MTYDFKSQRLFIDQDLAEGSMADLVKSQAHYLLNVLRMKVGDTLLVFNGKDGEWRASIATLAENFPNLVIADYAWIGENREMLRDRWVSWLAQ